MNQRITKLMLKHGMAVYDKNYSGVIACINDMLEQTALKLDEKANSYDPPIVSGDSALSSAFARSACITRDMKES